MKNMHSLFIILLAVLLWSCHSHQDGHTHGDETSHSHDSPSGGHDHSNTEDLAFAELTKAQMASIGLETGFVEKKQLTASLKANGFLKVPNQNRANVTAVLGGTVTAIHVQTGNIVRKGQALVSITNPAFITLQEEYLTVSESVELATIELNRQKDLQQGNANALKNVQQAEAELKKLKTRKASLSQQLALTGILPEKLSSENIRSSVNIVSPIAGSVSDVLVNMGSYVDPNMTIAEVVDHSQLHLDLYVFEKDLDKLKIGQTIHFTLTNNPGKEYDAKIYGISNTFEPQTRAVAVHAAVQGDKRGLIDGMSITALVSLDQATVDALPLDAFVHHQGQDYVFIESEPSSLTTGEKTEDNHVHFKRIPVRKGTTDIGYSEVTFLEEIPDSAKVVLKGAFFLMAQMTNQGEAHAH
jgi:RND family efflux transporter MFP subunit